MRIKLKLYGVYRSAFGSASIDLTLKQAQPTIRTVIAELISRQDCRALTKLLLDEESSDPRSNSIILVSDREIGALASLDTVLKEDDELSLLPIAHGG